MPQLAGRRKRCARLLRAKGGSALVGVVSLATIMAITSVGLLQVAGTAVNNEVAGLREAQAFWAAESGLQLAAKHIKDHGQLPAGALFANHVQIAEFSVVIESQNSANTGTANAIRSQVFADSIKQDATTFAKAVQADILQAPGSAGVIASIFNWKEINKY